MELYKNYLDEIESRKNQSLKPKPIDDASLPVSYTHLTLPTTDRV